MFWDWIIYEKGQGDPGWKQITVKLTVSMVTFFLVPVVIYEVVKWDPAIGVYEDGGPIKLGRWIIVGLYWIAAYLHASRHKARKRLNKLIDK